MRLHQLCSLFPPISQDDLRSLADDIKQNGLIEPIITFEGQVLDGQNRIAACKIAGVEPRFVEFEGDDPVAYVVSKNFNRRHLDQSQRAMVAARIASMVAKTAAHIPAAQENAANQLSVSSRSVRSARTVITSGDKDLVKAVDEGRVAVSVAAKIAVLEEDQREKVLQSPRPDVAIKQVAREVKEQKLAEKISALPDEVFGVIYADPAWRFETRSDNGMDRSADNHYPTQSTDDICSLDVGSVAADDSVLFLWATVPMLQEALEVMASWGFDYKSHFCWAKDRSGTGYWNRNRHELLLVGTRGQIPSPALGEQWPSVIDAAVGEHSAKPEIFYELIENYYPNLPKLEMNARGFGRKGWSIWGLEAEVA